MTLNDREAFNLEMEFLQQDLGRLPSEMPITTFKRELTRTLYERATADEGTCPRPLIPAAHSAIEDTLSAVVLCLDKVVPGRRPAWSRRVSRRFVDGVRAAATIISEAAARAGLKTPAQPVPQQPGEAEPRCACDCGCEDPAPAEPAEDEATADGQPAADWTPSDGGLTPSMFGGI